MGTRAERTCVALAGPRLAECGTNGAGSPTTSRHCGPTFAQINLMNGERSRPPNPGLQLGGNKASNL